MPSEDRGLRQNQPENLLSSQTRHPHHQSLGSPKVRGSPTRRLAGVEEEIITKLVGIHLWVLVHALKSRVCGKDFEPQTHETKKTEFPKHCNCYGLNFALESPKPQDLRT